jgi:hypothetical protein
MIKTIRSAGHSAACLQFQHLGGTDQEDHGSSPAQQKAHETLILANKKPVPVIPAIQEAEIRGLKSRLVLA